MQDTQSVTTTPTTPPVITNTKTTPSSIQKRAIIGLLRNGGDTKNDYIATRYSHNLYDTRIVVTGKEAFGLATCRLLRSTGVG